MATKTPTGFEIVSKIIRLCSRSTAKTVKAGKHARQAAVRFGPSILLQAKLDSTQRITLAKLANGLWAVVVDENGYKLLPANKDKTAFTVRFPMQCNFTHEAELMHGMWCFPENTFSPRPER